MLTEQDKGEANALMGAVEPLTGHLSIEVNEPGAEVYLDDVLVGTTPIDPMLVEIGPRKIRVHKAEFEDATRSVDVAGNAAVPVAMLLQHVTHEGRLNVHANANASIEIDGRTVGAGSWTGVVSSGGHTLRVVAPKMRPYQSEVYVQDKESRDVAVTLDVEANKEVIPLWGWIAGGAVLVGGLVTAGYFVFRPDSKYEGPPGTLNPGVVQASRSFP